MEGLLAASGCCNYGAPPNRQGYLILGDCPVSEPGEWETCAEGPTEPDFGILPCRCVRSAYRILVPGPSGTSALNVRDKVRTTVEIEVLCEF